MPTKQLPSNPSLDHLKHQAKDLLEAHAHPTPDVCQRIREFHPHHRHSSDAQIAESKFALSDALLTIAREHGFSSWMRLKTHIEHGEPIEHGLPLHERIKDALFRQAVDLLDSGDEQALAAHLKQHPEVVHQRVNFEGGNYFTNPSLLEFVAENPIRHDTLPPNIIQIAKIILDAGAKETPEAASMTLALVCSGRVSRECGVQIALIDLLCEYGADPNAGTGPALSHGEFEAAEACIQHGAKVDVAIAAALGKLDEVRNLYPTAEGESRHYAMPWAVQHGRLEVARFLLEKGEDPSRYNPMGAHSHSTPLHQAAFNGDLAMVRLLVEFGANLNAQDIHFKATPLGWAEHGERAVIADYLRSLQ